MQLSFQQRSVDLLQKFSQLLTWEDKYKKIIELGRALEPMDATLKTEENLVKGCQSQVWLWATLTPEGKVKMSGDSDALIVKGLVAILMQIYSNSTPQEILQNPPDFIGELGFKENLSQSRANGLYSMIKQIRNYALAFDYILKSKV
jgi:cysteine desulfuration protein SufE